MNTLIKKMGLVVLIFLLVFTAACTNKPEETTVGNETKDVKKIVEITIKGLKDGKQTISLEKIKSFKPITKEMESISSSGEIKKKKVKGTSLEDILKLYEVSQKNFSGIRFIAGDSYSIVVPKEILDKREILLAYEVNDKPLDEKALPLMSAIPDERSMYWVKNLVEIELLEEEQSSINRIEFIETAVSDLQQEDYTYYENVDKAVKTRELLKGLNEDSDKNGVYLKAVDGLEKEEAIDVFKSGYIKITGKDIPLFLSPDLPKGMHVKNILYFRCGDTAYFSLKQSLEAFEKKLVEDNEGVPLKSFFKEVGLVNGDKYLCTAQDGYEVEISADDIEKGLIYPRAKGGYALMFEGMSKNTKIKGIHKIEVVK
ncbi:molybdopterin-dependent oxidoreductase [Paramaledivibacter caminithermalis]|uniref:Oxidoreductase molybdopterin binding domain-containing protein n=1 Tax=Paramaledivibacter caminithermalis (strain DSM 15212 / CIP 107654 / DViRD3) TaxID=1121301 RepID=A0A1M6QS85_PARC5|nr:molybdopterin-dependent oxidoreductase [Paramaledivibacter caminithermalis]SHK23121.1 Oxidoreductase molybdopterin binding domain-containing protein [Paramaledivibacter caminithermalis DSM 15212]